MSDQDVIATLVKERERCRQLVNLYQQMRATPGGGPRGAPQGTLEIADRILTQVLDHLRDLPRKPADDLESESGREEARRLLQEIGDLLERAMIAERECRAGSVPPPPTGGVRARAMSLYANV